MRYIFVHGKNASLSKKELQCIFHDQISFQHPQFSLIESPEPIDQTLLNRLGGTIKIAEVFPEDPVEILKKNSEKKILFGVSQYGGEEALSKVLTVLKKSLKKEGLSARFVNKAGSNMSSGQLNQMKLLEKGVDLVRVWHGQWIWGKTVAFQDIDRYSKRDFGKPSRDMLSGMMPPKLAQMMINFAEPVSSTIMYDPFCGIGTILLEAVLRGNPVWGSDIKERMVRDSKNNLEWLLKTFSLESEILKQIHLFRHDATTPLSEDLSKDLAIVTEAYLGPLLLRFPERDLQQEIFGSLHKINARFFEHVGKKLSSGKKIIMCFPYFRSGKEKIFYPELFFHEYAKNGFRIENDLRSLLYEREQQVVGREIMIFGRL